ncbi:GTPase Era [Sulfurimonas sp. MAG313]|nr:GTPase Era [Sulfurimonas sp. MAG313]MDF1881583.1 GTPase Era [Sulfurimonas sp. MAG313]
MAEIKNTHNNNNEEIRSGFVAVVGRPNAGKSTLMNALLGEKISMVSQKANATRKRINAIVMHKENQLIFIDTPGLHEKEKMLNQFMMKEALKAIGDCDVILFMAPVTDSTEEYEKFLTLTKKPHIILLSKIDHVSNEKILLKIQEYQGYQDKFLAIIPVSVSKGGIGFESLLDETVKHLPISPYLYNPDDLTTEMLRDIYKEFIREAIFDNISDEIPYETDVLIDKVEEGKTLEKIRATIIVEKQTQKGIIIGKGGSAIKRIGRDSRLQIENLIGKKVFLDLFVSVKKGWTNDKKSLEDIGYKF